MEEKILIKSEKYNVKKVFIVMIILGIVISLLASFYFISRKMNKYNDIYFDNNVHHHSSSCYKYSYEDDYYDDLREGGLQTYKMDCPVIVYGSAFSYAIDGFLRGQVYLCIIPAIAFTLLGLLIFLWLRSYELTVTDKRIYGKVAWGKRVDLPVDSVSATSTIRLLKGVSVSTSSGRISFRVIKNADEIYKIMNELLIARQQDKTNKTIPSSPRTDEADQLKKYKELLDLGIITQEEFDTKKKQLLGL